MNKATTQINWDDIEEKALGMTNDALHYAIDDIIATLPHSDALDREDEGCRGGYYRDEISIYRGVLAHRISKGADLQPI